MGRVIHIRLIPEECCIYYTALTLTAPKNMAMVAGGGGGGMNQRSLTGYRSATLLLNFEKLSGKIG